MGSGGNTVTVADRRGTGTTVNSGAGSDTVDVTDTSSPLTVNTQTGTDTVNVQAIGTRPASTRVAATIGSTCPRAPANTGTLAGHRRCVDGQRRPGHQHGQCQRHGRRPFEHQHVERHGLTSTAFGSGGGLSYSSLAALNVSLGSGGNTVTVAGTASGTSTTVNSGAGSDTVNVMGTSSPLTVNTQTGTDTVNVQAIGAPASINAGGGNDTIDVSSNAPANTGTLAGIAAVLTVNGGSGTSTANVSDTGDGIRAPAR